RMEGQGYRLIKNVSPRLCDFGLVRTANEKVGDALKTQGKLTAAVEEYRVSLDQRRGLSDQYKSNAGWQRDFIGLLCKLAAGEALDDNGDKAKALLEEATNLAGEYNGSDRETLIDLISQSFRSITVGQAPK
ncbi:MAG: hypothetical protein JO232_23990, partial [Verrucomicrobia bacterium]|nr:hypothetical protein [Verrucomicrobiota bacterium]